MIVSDDWIECQCGKEHWGVFGAAGLLLVQLDEQNRITHILLQHRAPWVDQGDTWGIPGGALHYGESTIGAALRESKEETGINLENIRVIGSSAVDHGNWAYTTVVAVPTGPIATEAIDHESLAVEWVATGDLDQRPLHQGFASSWKTLQRKIEEGSL